MGEWVAMSILAGALLLVALYYLRKAIRTLRRTTPAYEMLPDERRYLRRQAWRRVVNSVLMLVLVTLLVGSYLSGMQRRADEIDRERKVLAVAGQQQPLTDEQRAFMRAFGGIMIAVLILLGGIVILAGFDLFATRRYAITQLRQIQADRRAMIEREISRWREERDGPAWN